MRDNLCYICLDPNHCRQACPYKEEICNQESSVISIEHQIQMDRIFAKGKIIMPFNQELYLKTMLTGTSQIKLIKEDRNQGRIFKVNRMFKTMVEDQMYILFHQE